MNPLIMIYLLFGLVLAIAYNKEMNVDWSLGLVVFWPFYVIHGFYGFIKHNIIRPMKGIK